MEFLITLFFIVAFVVIVFVLITWIVHIDMTKSNYYPCGWGNYRKFKNEFYKVEWEYRTLWRNSLFGKKDGYFSNDKDYLHASIIKFGGKGMMMRTPWDYILTQLLIRKEAKKLRNESGIKIKW